MDLSHINTLLGIVAVVISISIGIGTLRQRANEPNERRWRQFDEWKDTVNQKLNRDYRVLNGIGDQMDRREEFECISLASTKGILSHLMKGNNTDQMRKLSEDIDAYLLKQHRNRSSWNDV